MTEFAKKKLEYFVKCGRPRPVDTEFIKGMTSDVFDGCTMDEIKNYLYNVTKNFYPKNDVELKNMHNLIISYAQTILNERESNVKNFTRLHHLYSKQEQQKALCRMYYVEQKCIDSIKELIQQLKESNNDIYKNTRMFVTVSLANPRASFKEKFNEKFEEIFEGTNAFKTYEKLQKTFENYVNAFENNKLKDAEEYRNQINATEKELLAEMKKEVLSHEKSEAR